MYKINLYVIAKYYLHQKVVRKLNNANSLIYFNLYKGTTLSADKTIVIIAVRFEEVVPFTCIGS